MRVLLTYKREQLSFFDIKRNISEVFLKFEVFDWLVGESINADSIAFNQNWLLIGGFLSWIKTFPACASDSFDLLKFDENNQDHASNHLEEEHGQISSAVVNRPGTIIIMHASSIVILLCVRP